MEHKIKSTNRLPIVLAIGSFVVLTFIAILTNPQQTIALIPLFFVSLWLAVFSLLWLITSFIFKIRPKLKTHIALISTALVLFLMLKSTGEIRPIDGAVLLLLMSGLAFYINRRS